MSPLAAALSIYWRPVVSRFVVGTYAAAAVLAVAALVSGTDDPGALALAAGSIGLLPAYLIGVTLAEQYRWSHALLLPRTRRTQAAAACLAVAALQFLPTAAALLAAGAQPVVALLSAAAAGSVAMAAGLSDLRTPRLALLALGGVWLVANLVGGSVVSAMLRPGQDDLPAIAAAAAVLAAGVAGLALALSRRARPAGRAPDTEGTHVASAAETATRSVAAASVIRTARRLGGAWAGRASWWPAFACGAAVAWCASAIADGDDYAVPLARGAFHLLALWLFSLPQAGEAEAVRADRVRPLPAATFANVVLAVAALVVWRCWLLLLAGAAAVFGVLVLASVEPLAVAVDSMLACIATAAAMPMVTALRCLFLRRIRGTSGSVGPAAAAMAPLIVLAFSLPFLAHPDFSGWVEVAALTVVAGIAWCWAERRRWRDGDLA